MIHWALDLVHINVRYLSFVVLERSRETVRDVSISAGDGKELAGCRS